MDACTLKNMHIFKGVYVKKLILNPLRLIVVWFKTLKNVNILKF